MLASQLLAQGGNREEVEKLLISAANQVSITEVKTLATLSEVLSDNFTCEVLHSIASDRCHCMDSADYFFPIEHPVFRCEECNIEVCGACASHCHKGHKTVEIGSYSSFTCGCGRRHFKGRCSFEYVGQSDRIHQHFFRCLDCCCDDKKLVCRGCAEKCHKGHNIVYVGVMCGFCSCGANKLGNGRQCEVVSCDYQNSCCEKKKEVAQRFFQCATRGICSSDEDGVCLECALKCHAGHVLFDRGVRKGQRRCCEKGKCKLEK